MSTQAERLSEAMERAQVRSGAELARRTGLRENTVRAHISGLRQIPWPKAELYARALRCDATWLFNGKGATKSVTPATSPTVPLLGYVGAGETVYPVVEARGHGEPVEAPPGLDDQGGALDVQGTSQQPRWFDGDRIFYGRARRGGEIGDLVGRDAICELDDGRMLLKRILPGSRKGLHTLGSYNTPELIMDVKIISAAPVEWTYHRPRALGRRLLAS